MGDMSDRRTIAGILALTVGGYLVVSCLAVGLMPLLVGAENCSTTFQPFGEGGFRAWTEFSVLPYGGLCVFQDPYTGQILRTSPDPRWSVGLVGGSLVGLIGVASLAGQATRRREAQQRSTVLG